MPYPSPGLQHVLLPMVCCKTSTAKLSCQTLLHSAFLMHIVGNKLRGQGVCPKKLSAETAQMHQYHMYIHRMDKGVWVNRRYCFQFADPFPSSQPFFGPLSHCFVSNLYYKPAGTGFYVICKITSICLQCNRNNWNDCLWNTEPSQLNYKIYFNENNNCFTKFITVIGS